MQQLNTKSTDQKLQFVKASTLSNSEDIWNSILGTSSLAWYRHTLNLKSFHSTVASEKNVIDESFFIAKDNRFIGIQPILIMDEANGLKQALYNGGPLPWPCFIDTEQEHWDELQDLALKNLIAICQSHNVDRCDIALNAPHLTEDNSAKLFENAVYNHGFIDTSFPSHLVNVHEKSYDDMRASYRRNVRKFSKLFEAQTYQGQDVDETIEQAYFELHVKDAGGQFRSRESYTAMADLARKNEACFIIAREKETQKIVGILVLAIYKNAAYDSSVAIDPEYHQSYISHILKAEALRFLFEKNIVHYELGAVALAPSLNGIPTHKNKQISFFKDGFARGKTKKVFVAEKHFTTKSIEHRTKSIEHTLVDYYKVSE